MAKFLGEFITSSSQKIVGSLLKLHLFDEDNNGTDIKLNFKIVLLMLLKSNYFKHTSTFKD